MALPKEQNHTWKNMLAASGLSGKTITGVDVYKLGSMTVLEINFSGGPTYVKHQHGMVDFGGTAEWGTGTGRYSV